MANKINLTNWMEGWFNVRQFNEKIARENWKLKGEDENITFTTSLNLDDPQCDNFKKFGKIAETDSGQVLRVTFKIGGRCRWYNTDGQEMAKPQNSQLDGRKWRVVLQYSEVSPTNSLLSPRGYWAHAILVEEMDTNPFALFCSNIDVAPAAATEPTPTPAATDDFLF